MMKAKTLVVILVALLLGSQMIAYGETKILYDFENGLDGWEIPDWSFEDDNYRAEKIDVSEDFASSGKSSLRIDADLTGGSWQGAIVEVMEYMDWTPYSTIACDVLIPPDAPEGLKAKIILTVGEKWSWTEMSRSVKLTPGGWMTITANLLPGSMDWKRINPTDEFRADVRKINVRIESNKKPAFTGPFYVDRVRVE